MKIDVQRTEFFSELDEEYFFTWALEIACVERIHSGYLFINDSEIDESSLRELLAMFYRYNVNSSCLAKFCNQENESWFKNPIAYWYNDVFEEDA